MLFDGENDYNKNVEQTLNFLYPDGFQKSDRINSYVVGVTNNLNFQNHPNTEKNIIRQFIIAVGVD